MKKNENESYLWHLLLPEYPKQTMIRCSGNKNVPQAPALKS